MRIQILDGVSKMLNEDTFNGAKNGLAFYFAYLNTIAQEKGMDEATALLSKSEKLMGATQGRIIREQAGLKDCDAQTAYSLAANSIKEGLGMTSRALEANPKKAVFKIGRCSIYEAAQTAGMDNKTIAALCHAGSLNFMDSMVKQFNPNLQYRLRKFRPSADDFCEEEIVAD